MHLGVELLSHMVTGNSMFKLLRNCQSILHCGWTISPFPPAVYVISIFRVLSVVIICLFNYSHPSECSGYLIIVLTCIFWWLRCSAFFHVLIVHLHREKSVRILCPSLIVFYLFNYWVVGVFIYILLDASPSSDVWFPLKHFPFCGVVFLLSVKFLGAQRFLILMMSSVYSFSLGACPFCVISEKLSPNPRSEDWRLCFPLRVYSFSSNI